MERRRATRHRLELAVEIWPELDRKPVKPVFLTVRDISSLGFYFETDSHSQPSAKVNFSIIFPQEVTGDQPAYVNSIGRIVRVWKISEDRVGFGVQIEKVHMWPFT